MAQVSTIIPSVKTKHYKYQGQHVLPNWAEMNNWPEKKKKKNWTNHEDVKVKNQTNTQQFQVSFNSCLVKILSQLGIMPY